MTKQEIFNALRDDDRTRCLKTLRLMAEKNSTSTTSFLLEALDDEDKKLHSRSVWVLSLLPLKENFEVANALTHCLKNDADQNVRLCCAIGLMSHKTSPVRDAYISAVRDVYDKVAQIACGQLGFFGGMEATTALFETLSNPLWRVRLEACKALITLKAADKRVVSTLDQMCQESEASKYDAEHDEFERLIGNVELPDEWQGMWGKIGTILEQARQIAAEQEEI